ncbi:trypsin-like serine protease [Geobacter sp.]|uniref:trypsin-like serine protease n=1 Tax=Geobacter sp. TaxID=46610 RepID=UPI0027B93681|nr:trypsin-like serine protease [Geobacter sp.]
MEFIQSTMRRRAVKRGVLGLLTILVATLLPTASDALRGGTVIEGYPGVVEGGGCTGSMIAPNVVLTAAHCFDMLGAPTNSRGTGNFSIFYHDPERGRRQVFVGTATWIVSPSYRGKVDGVSAAGNADADHGVIMITRSVSGTDRFTDTDYHDYLRIYSDKREFLDTELQACGAGSYTYSGKKDDKLRTSWLEVENVEYNHIVVDTRDKVNVCKGDSGGPLIYLARASGHDIPTIAGVLARMDTESVIEGENCAHNDPPHDDAYYSRISWEVIRFIEAQTGISCRVHKSASKEYVRCFDLPFIEDIESEGMQRDLAVALTVSSIN